MRKSKEATIETRKRIVEAASEEFRRNGIDGTGLADLMAAAGLTHGGFYKHFDSKEQVVAESVELATHSMVEAMRLTVSDSPDDRGLHAAIADYVSIKYRDDVAAGCPFVALGSDLARGSDAVREVATRGFLDLVNIFAAQLGNVSPVAAKSDAMVMLCTMIGAVTMARVVTDSKLSLAILKHSRERLIRSCDK